MRSFYRGLRRSLLFVPGHKRNMIVKALATEADCVILDLEDSVPPERKKEAREVTRESLTDVDFGAKEIAVRINSLKTPFWECDLREIIKARPHTLIVPKVEEPEILRTLDDLVTKLEKNGVRNGTETSIISLIETPLSLVNVNKISTSAPRLTGLMFGAGDFLMETRGETTRERYELYYPLIKILLAARIAKIDAIDSPFLNIKDIEGCELNCRQARILGYDGKAAIHPSQVSIINEAFTPSPEKVEHARRVIEAHERARNEGSGVAQLNGQLIESLHVRIAERILELSEKAKAKR